MFRSRFLMAAFVAAIAALAGPATSQAGFQISASDGTNSATIGDNNVGNTSFGSVSGVSDTNSATGGISTPQILIPPGAVPGGAFKVGDFLIGVDVTTTSNATGSSFSTSSHTLIRNTGADGTLTITTSNVFILPFNVHMDLSQSMTTDAYRDSAGGKLSGVTGDTVTSVAKADDGLNSATTAALFSDHTGFGATSPTVLFTRTNLFYSLTQTFTIFLHAGDSVQLQGSAFLDTIPGDHLLITPAPAGLILAATGLPFLGLLRRRMRRTETTVAA